MDHESALQKAIRYFGSQRALALALKTTSTRINNWLNRDKTIPFEYAIAIEKLTNGTINRYELAPYANWLHKWKRNTEELKEQ